MLRVSSGIRGRWKGRSAAITHLLLMLLLAQGYQAQECRGRSFGWDSVVCVCDAHHCDLPGPVTPPDPGHYTVVTSSRDGLRFHTETHKLESQKPAETRESVLVEVALRSPRQTWLGFGSSFTDAAGLNVLALSKQTQDFFMRSYFSPEGLDYQLCRVPIGGADFSTRPYSYNDDRPDDPSHFQLADEDYNYKLPLLRRARQLAGDLRLVASPWSPPAWMKVKPVYNDTSELRPEMRQAWADYIVKFLKEYERAGVPMWGLTTQNHPTSTDCPWNSCFWTEEAMRDWIRDFLGPALENNGFGPDRLQVIIGEEFRATLGSFVKSVLAEAEVAHYVSGVSVHWYNDLTEGPHLLDRHHYLFPDKPILYLEACFVPGWQTVSTKYKEAVALGSWLRAQDYAHNIIEDVNHYVSSWVDWNMALDQDGGPNWADNYVDAPVIVNAAADEFYKQPMFYVLGHFSRFVRVGMRVVPSWVSDASTTTTPGHHAVHTAAFTAADPATLVVVLLNTDEQDHFVSIEAQRGVMATVRLPAQAIQTVVMRLPDVDDSLAHARTKYAHD